MNLIISLLVKYTPIVTVVFTDIGLRKERTGKAFRPGPEPKQPGNSRDPRIQKRSGGGYKAGKGAQTSRTQPAENRSHDKGAKPNSASATGSTPQGVDNTSKGLVGQWS